MVVVRLRYISHESDSTHHYMTVSFRRWWWWPFSRVTRTYYTEKGKGEWWELDDGNELVSSAKDRLLTRVWWSARRRELKLEEALREIVPEVKPRVEEQTPAPQVRTSVDREELKRQMIERMAQYERNNWEQIARELSEVADREKRARLMRVK